MSLPHHLVGILTPLAMDLIESELWAIVLGCAALKKRKGRRRSIWVKKWLQRRDERGYRTQIFRELSVENESYFQNYTKHPVHLFDSLLKKMTHFRERRHHLTWSKIRGNLVFVIRLLVYITAAFYKNFKI